MLGPVRGVRAGPSFVSHGLGGVMFRKVLVGLAVVGLLLVGPASAAQAVESVQSSRMADAPDFTPSGSKWREYMLNVTSKILRGATGGRVDLTGSWRAEHIGNQYRYAPSAEQLNRMHMNSTYNPNYATAPDSYEDYRLREMTRATKDGGRKLKVQATPAQKFIKAGGALSLFGAVPMIGGFGSDLVGGWIGVGDMQDEWCSADANFHADGLGWFSMGLGVLSGRDCSMWAYDNSYDPNSDSVPNWSSAAGYTYVGTAPYMNGVFFHCYVSTRPTEDGAPSGYRMEMMGPDGYWLVTTAPTRNKVDRCTRVFPQSTHRTDALNPNDPRLRMVSNSTGEVAEEMSVSLSDPERYMECVVTLDDGTVLTAEGERYHESEGSFKPPACPSVPEGRYATNIKINEKTTDGSIAPTTVYDEDTTPEYQDWATSFPECAEGACALDLRMKNGDKLGASCFDLPDGCPDWFEDPEKTSKYQCTYGANKVDLEECTVYAGLFQPGRVAVGGAYSDPMTGEWTGGSNSVTLDRQAMGQKIQNPASTRSCNGLGGGGFDPVGFVMRPIQCALEWAFVPRPLVVEASLAGGGEAWEGKPPAVIADAVQSFTATPAVSGCSISVTIFSGMFQQNVTPLDACPGSFARPFADASRVITSAVMVVLVVVVVRRQIAGMIGYGQGQ